MLAQQAAQFSFFWSILVPASMAAGSIVITYLLYRHFAAEVEQRHHK
jgi:hypothetical protein